MRRDLRNTGCLSVVVRYSGDQPWSFRTGRGIFTTPVVDHEGSAYVGSADGFVYALDKSGECLWRVRTSGIVDSAGLLDHDHLTVGSGDGYLYRIRTDASLPRGVDRIAWTFKALPPEGSGQEVSWWEGNVVAGPDGTLLAGNTAGHAYAVRTDGTQAWVYPTGNAVWTAAAVGADGTSYWGSLDFCVHAVDRHGDCKWTVPTIGFVVSSPALGTDGALYVGSFDGQLYALDAATGEQRWAYMTADSIYSSPALLEVDGSTRAIYVGSTDGCVYALRPDGTLLWRYDTGAIIRSSPVLSRKPEGEEGWIVYVGSSDGVLYALDAEQGTRRWSYDTTMSDPVLADRNSLNGSPALGLTGIHIASEDGSIWYIPYDYPLHHEDPRATTDPAEPIALELEQLLLTTPGGATVREAAPEVGPAAVVALRLVVRRHGVTLDAEIESDVTVTTSAASPVSWRRSGDGHFLFVVPQEFWPSAGSVELHVRGAWTAARGVPGGIALHGDIDQTICFTVARADPSVPLVLGAPEQAVLHLHRLSVALPSFATSVNQIGFDSYDWLVGTVLLEPETERTGALVLFVRGALSDAEGVLRTDPASPFAFSLHGRYEGNSVSVVARGVDLPFSFGDVPMDRFELRFQLDGDLRSSPGASMYGEVVCADVPFYGPLLVDFTRLADEEGRMAASGTFLVGPADPRSPTTRLPAGMHVTAWRLERPTSLKSGSLSVTVTGQVDAGEISVILLDAASKDSVAAPSFREAIAGPDTGATTIVFDIDRQADLPTTVEAIAMFGVVALGRMPV